MQFRLPVDGPRRNALLAAIAAIALILGWWLGWGRGPEVSHCARHAG